MVKVLFVCMGNICRSPSAHGVFRHLLEQSSLERAIEVDSAGTHAYHVGEPPDRRSQQAARERGYDISDLRARAVNAYDFDYYDYILVADRVNYETLAADFPHEMSAPEARQKVRFLLDFATGLPQSSSPHEVPDPYYGGARGFEHVLDLIEDACQGLLAHIQVHHLAKGA